MSTERVAVRVSDAEMNRRWDAVRKLMRERGIQALVAYHTEDWLGGHARWFTDIPTHNGYGRTVIFHADDLMTIVQQGNFGARRKLDGKDPYHRGVGEMRLTPFFSSVRYTTGYHTDIVREVIKERGYKTIGFVLPETMPHKLVNGIVEGFDGLKVIDITEQIDRLIAIKGPDELDLLRRSAEMQDKVFEKVVQEIKPGMRDIDVTAMAYGYGWTQGSSQGIYLGASNPVGKPSLLMGRHFQDRVLQKGDHMTFLVEVNGPGGYFTEVGRTIVLGKASQELKDSFAADRRGAGLFGEPAQARRLMPRDRAAARRVHEGEGAAARIAALQPRPGLRHGRAAADPHGRADGDRAGHVPRGASGLRDAEPVRDGVRQLHRRRQQHRPHPQDRAEDFRGAIGSTLGCGVDPGALSPSP